MNLTAIISRGAAGVTLTLAAHFLVSCGTPGGGGLGGGSTSDGVETPKHGLPRYEYPFDSDGEYNEAWAREGEQRQGWNTDRTYADVDFGRTGSDDDEKPEKPSRVASRTRSVPANEKKKEKTGGGLFASRTKKQQPVEPQPQPVVASARSAPTRQATKPPQERLLASNLASQNSSNWDRSRIPSSVATYQPPRTQSPAMRPEPTVEVRRSPLVKQVRPVEPEPTPKPVVAKAPPTPKPTPKPTPPPAPKRHHVVVKGDTLYNISVRYKTNVASIKSRNRLSSDTIRLGQSLEIP